MCIVVVSFVPLISVVNVSSKRPREAAKTQQQREANYMCTLDSKTY